MLFNMEMKDMKKKEIAVVDDNHDTLLLLKTLLEKENYIVKTFSEPEPVYTMRENFPHLLLLDVNLGQENGHDLCGYLKKNPLTQHIPVIMYSAKPIERNSGAEVCFNKPFNLSELKNTICQLIDRNVNVSFS